MTVTVTRVYVVKKVPTKIQAWLLLEKDPLKYLDFQSTVVSADESDEAAKHRKLKMIYGK